MNFACEKSLKACTNLVGKRVSLKKKEKDFGKKDPESLLRKKGAKKKSKEQNRKMSASRQEMRVLVYPVVSLIGDCKHHKKGEGREEWGGGGRFEGVSARGWVNSLAVGPPAGRHLWGFWIPWASDSSDFNHLFFLVSCC